MTCLLEASAEELPIFFVFFAFPWFVLGKQQFPYVFPPGLACFFAVGSPE